MATQLEETLAQLSRSERSLRRLTLAAPFDRVEIKDGGEG